MGVRTQAVTGIELDLGRYELRRHGRRVKLEKKPMELLIFLVSRRDQLVSRDDIVKKLWRSDLFVETEPNINNIVRKIRAALADNPDKPRFLETVVGKGYRFIGPVRVIGARFPQSNPEFTQTERGRALTTARTDHPSLAVVPFLPFGNVRDDHGVCLGFADGLLSRLANLLGVNVLPTSAVLNLPPDMSAPNVAAHLGVRFLVHGAIREAKGQWQLSLEMFDTHRQSPCFSRKCTLDLDRLFDLEDELARQIAKTLNRPLSQAQLERRPRYSKDPFA